MNYICRYRKYYPAETREQIWCEVPMIEGYAMIAGGMNLDGFLQFSGVAIADGGYIKQEIEKMLKKSKQ